MDKYPGSNERMRRLIRLGGGLAAAALAAACAVVNKPAQTERPSGTSTTTAETPRTVGYVMLTPDLSGFLKDPATCRNGGARPCVALLRESPDLTAPNVTLVAGGLALWPRESYAGEKGDAVKVVCQVSGQAVNSYQEGDQSSTVWEVAEVPAEHLSAQALALSDAQAAQPPFGVVRGDDGNVAEAYVYGSAKWFENQSVMPQLAACTSDENPAGYPPAR